MIWAWSCLAWDFEVMEDGFLRIDLRRVEDEAMEVALCACLKFSW